MDGQGMSLAHKMAGNGHIFSMEEIIQLGNPKDKSGRTVAHYMALYGRHSFAFEEINQLGNPKDRGGRTIAHEMAKYGRLFTTDQIIAMGDATLEAAGSISILMAEHGHIFSYDEIVRLKNPAGRLGATLAHFSAWRGYRFTIDELLVIGNAVIAYSKDDLLWMDGNQNWWTMDEEHEYQQRDYIYHNGATVAHIMAREGHRFTTEEIQRLGNPKDKAGLTIADWMDRAGQDKN